MIYLSFINIEDISWPMISMKLSALSNQEESRILQLKNTKHRIQRLCARLLLCYMLKRFFNNRISQPCLIDYDKFGKPFLCNNVGVDDVAIAHSNNIVLCAISTEDKIGVDVEFVRDYCIHDFYSILSEKEIKYFENETINVCKEFVRIWTLKESITKTIGKGLSYDFSLIDTTRLLNENSIFLDDTIFHIHPLEIDDRYVCFLTSKQPINENLLILRLFIDQL